MSDRLVVYTDGACSRNPGPGGWAWAADGGEPYATGFDPMTTNQRMEVTAAAKSVEANDGPLEVRSDSIYVVNCFNKRWYEKWLSNGWKNSQRQPVANRDLWEPFIGAVLERGNVVFQWVKGHDLDAMNLLVDRLAVEAVQQQRGRHS